MSARPVMLIVIAVNLICLFIFERISTKILLKNELDKNVEIVSGIANNILAVERVTERALSNALQVLEGYLLAKPKASNEELKTLKDKLNVTSLITVDKHGKYLKYIKGGVEIDKATEEKLKHISLFEKPYSASYKDLQNESGKVIYLPFFTSATRQLFTNKQVVTKSAAVWLDSLQMYLCVTLDEDYVHENLNDNFLLHKELQSLSIFTPSGTTLLQSMKGDYKPSDKIEEIAEYAETPIIHNSDKLEVILPFGGIQKENGSAINKGLANSNDEYFYVLKADFAKTKLNKQLLVVRLLLAGFFVFMSGVVCVLRKNLF